MSDEPTQIEIDQQYAAAFLELVRGGFQEAQLSVALSADAVVTNQGVPLSLPSWQNSYGLNEELNRAYSAEMNPEDESKALVTSGGHKHFKYRALDVDLTKLSAKLPESLELHKKLSLHDLVILYAAAAASETAVRRKNGISTNEISEAKGTSQEQKINKQIEEARKNFINTAAVELGLRLPDASPLPISQLVVQESGSFWEASKPKASSRLLEIVRSVHNEKCIQLNNSLLTAQRKAIAEGALGVALVASVSALVGLNSADQFPMPGTSGPLYKSMIDGDVTAITSAVIAVLCVAVGISLAIDGYKKYQEAAAKQVGDSYSPAPRSPSF